MELLAKSELVPPAPDFEQSLIRRIESGTLDVQTYQETLSLLERMTKMRNQSRWNRALIGAQNELRPIVADSENPQTRSRYASLKAIQLVVAPIASKYDLTVTFDTDDSPLADHVRIVGDLLHVDGHSRRYHLDMPADGKGARGGDVMTRTHAVGSSLSYGQRYLLKLIFNLAIDDDDGNRASVTVPDVPQAPEGFDDWWSDLCATADTGSAALEKAWSASPRPLKEYANTARRKAWEALKVRAGKVK